MKKVFAALTLAGMFLPSIAFACALPPSHEKVSQEVMTTVAERSWTGRQSKRLIRTAAERRMMGQTGMTRYPRYKGL